ncbi:MAG: acetate--CoA ligase family protein [Candidatus Competibacteraceae bacterium]|nr:acetate--CoA ligase family protein [Candidatus Competibacteraceae bacterium]
MNTALQRLLQPRHIAVIGGREAAEVIRQCERIGFAGPIWPVNPKRAELAGRACFARIADLPAAPDAVFIAVPPLATVQAVAELAALGAGGAVCYAAGFAEAGGQGQMLHEQLLAAAGEMALIGPNCYGLLNYLDGAALWPDVHGGNTLERGVALITQSGNIGLNLTMQQRSLPLAYLISLGNSAQLGVPELIRALLQDLRISAIGLHLEGLRDVPAFAAAAGAALARKIPIVVLKTGRSAAGARATLSHTGSLAGSDTLYDALFQRCGVARVDTLAELLETLKFLHSVGSLAEPSLASLSCSGGEASLIADLAEPLGLEFPALSATQRTELHEQLGDRVTLDNPLDYHTYIWGDLARQTACFTALLRGSQAVNVLIMDYPLPACGEDQHWLTTEQALLAARNAIGARAAIVSSLPENFPLVARERLLTQGIPPMQGLHECLIALRAAARIGQAQQRPRQPALPVLPVLAGGAFDGPRRMLDEWQSKQALAGFGLCVPDGQLCSTYNAVTVAESLGYPVVLKAVSSQLAHKTEVGGVALNLHSAAEVQAAVVRLAPLSDTLLLERMVDDAVAELLVGILRDAQFGLVLVLGSGGVQAELLADVRQLLLPCHSDEIRQALLSLRLAPLLTGYRGRPAADLDAAVAAVQAISGYALAHQDALLELDVNPLLLRPAGLGAVAADALVRLGADL